MNANVTTFALALASNFNAPFHIEWALAKLTHYDAFQVSHVFNIPCRDGVGADYLNCACIFQSTLTKNEIEAYIKQLEDMTGRVRPSHKISLDIDLIAWKTDRWYFNQKKMPFALDVKIPMAELVQHPYFKVERR